MNVFVLFTAFLFGTTSEALPVDVCESNLEILIPRDVVVESNITSTEIKESLKVTPWLPEKENEMIFVIPKRLNASETITLECSLNQQRSRISVNLTSADYRGSPDLSNVIWQQTLDFEQNMLTHSTIKNGHTQTYNNSIPLEEYTIDKFYNLTITIDASYISGRIGDVILDDVPLEHDLSEIFTVIIAGWTIDANKAWPIRPREIDKDKTESSEKVMETSIYVIPKIIKPADTIALDCDLNQRPSIIIVKLIGADSVGAPDLKNVVWQQTLDFAKIDITHSMILNGITHTHKSSYSLPEYKIEKVLNLTIIAYESFISGQIGKVDLEDLLIQHNLEDIRFLSIFGDIKNVNRLEFTYSD